MYIIIPEMIMIIREYNFSKKIKKVLDFKLKK